MSGTTFGRLGNGLLVSISNCPLGQSALGVGLSLFHKLISWPAISALLLSCKDETNIYHCTAQFPFVVSLV